VATAAIGTGSGYSGNWQLAVAVARPATDTGSGYSGYSGNWQWLQWQSAPAVATPAVATVAIDSDSGYSGNWLQWQLTVAIGSGYSGSGSGTHRQIGHGCQVPPNSVPQRHVPHPELLHKL
jgi:hypothetical protein